MNNGPINYVRTLEAAYYGDLRRKLAPINWLSYKSLTCLLANTSMAALLSSSCPSILWSSSLDMDSLSRSVESTTKITNCKREATHVHLPLDGTQFVSSPLCWSSKCSTLLSAIPARIRKMSLTLVHLLWHRVLSLSLTCPPRSHMMKCMFFQTTSSTLEPIVGEVWTTSFIRNW